MLSWVEVALKGCSFEIIPVQPWHLSRDTGVPHVSDMAGHVHGQRKETDLTVSVKTSSVQETTVHSSLGVQHPHSP